MIKLQMKFIKILLFLTKNLYQLILKKSENK